MLPCVDGALQSGISGLAMGCAMGPVGQLLEAMTPPALCSGTRSFFWLMTVVVLAASGVSVRTFVYIAIACASRAIIVFHEDHGDGMHTYTWLHHVFAISIVLVFIGVISDLSFEVAFYLDVLLLAIMWALALMEKAFGRFDNRSA